MASDAIKSTHGQKDIFHGHHVTYPVNSADIMFHNLPSLSTQLVVKCSAVYLDG